MIAITKYTLTSIPGGAKAVYSTTFHNTGSRANFERLRFIPSGTQTLRISNPKIITASK